MLTSLINNKRDTPSVNNNKQFFFQPKLTINQPNDIYEQEADAMADRVMHDNPVEQPSFFRPSVINAQRKCAHCEEEDKKVQRKEMDTLNTVPETASSQLQETKGGGMALDRQTRQFMEARFNADFSGVRIHANNTAAEISRSINAKAFTTGNDIYFNKNEYDPASNKGRHLLAHELTHTLQQTGTIQRKTDCSYEKFEHEITGVGAALKYLKATPDADASNFPGEAIIDGDIVTVKNEGGALTYNNIKNCTWAWVEVPGKRSTDKNYPVLHGFIETRYLKNKTAPEPSLPEPAKPVSETISFIEGPEIIYPGGQFEYTAHAMAPLQTPVNFSGVKWAFQYNSEAVNNFDTSKGLSVDDNMATLNVFIPAGKKAEKITIFAYATSPENGASKASILKPVSIVESEKDKGKKEDGTIADDMKYSDFTPDQVKEIGMSFKLDYLVSYSDEQLFSFLKSMASTLFSVGELETNALAMIDHFKDNTGADYSSPALTKAVEKHEATKRFIMYVKMELSKKILAEKEGIKQTAVTKGALEKYRPVFNSTGDTFAGGLTFAINDTWAYQSEITYLDYKNDKDFQGKLKVTLYDDFGLDKPDVEKKYGYLQGFRAWFILQHDRGYKPFITVVEMEVPFDESIAEIEPKMKAEEQAAKDRAEYEKTFKRPPGNAKY